MDYSFDYAYNGDGLGFLIFWILYGLFSGGFGIALYVLRSYGVYSIAKNRGIRRAWFAWLPLVDQYMLGCISDQYRYVAKGQVKNKRKVMLTLNILLGVLSVVFMVLYIVLLVGAIQGTMGAMNGNAVASRAMGIVLAILGCFLPTLGLGIAATVFRYMALYDLYTSCSPANNVLFLVLSIFFPVTEPFFLFFNRKKEDGMPPRKQTQPEEPVYRTLPEYRPEPEADSWNRPDYE